MKRIVLLIATNLAIMLVLGIVTTLTGANRFFTADGLNLGKLLIFAGILVWAPYFYLKATQQPVEVMDYLPFHLAGVLGGVVVLVASHFLGRKRAMNEIEQAGFTK